MEKKYLIAVDIGTQGTKTALVRIDGTILGTSFCAAVFHEEEKGKFEQNPEEIYDSVTNTIRLVMTNNGIQKEEVAAIGLDGMMAGIIGLDKEGHAITPYDSGLDKRCESVIPQMQELGEEKVIAICGCPIIVAQGAKMYWWKEKHKEIYEKISKFVPISSYVCGRMAGLKAENTYIDYTHIHLTCLADVEHNCWSEELLKLYGFDGNKLPRIVKPWEVIGGITREAADRTGLLAGTPIVAGCGDTPASTFGAGVTKPGMMLDISGTASALSGCVKNYQKENINNILLYPRSVLEDLWTPFGFVLGGQAMDWYRGQTGMDFRDLDREANMAENENLFFIPYFAGRICPSDPLCSGSWVGMKFYHKRANMHKSVMEAIAFEYKHYLECLSEIQSIEDIDYVTVISGGAKSSVLTQIKADVLGIPFRSLKQKDTALLGAAVLAGYGIGIYDDLAKTVEGMIEQYTLIEPRSEKTEKYEVEYRKYREIVTLTSNIYHQVKL